MDKQLSLVKSEKFGETQCDFYGNGLGEFFMTRDQIGKALEYANPQKAIDNIHSKHRERMDKYSVTLKVRATDGKFYDTILYPRKGIMEICRWSQQPKADAFMDWAWNVLDGLMSGKTAIVGMTEYQRLIAQSRSDNAHIRKARELERLAEKYKGKSFEQVLDSYASMELTGEHLVPLPQLAARTYTAAEIGERLGITACKVGLLTNQNGLKTSEYGVWMVDKAKSADKEVQSFHYYAAVIPALQRILDVLPAA